MSTTPNMNAAKILRTDRDVPCHEWRLVGLWRFVGVPDGRRMAAGGLREFGCTVVTEEGERGQQYWGQSDMAVSGFMAVGGHGGSWFKMIGGSLGRHL